MKFLCLYLVLSLTVLQQCFATPLTSVKVPRLTGKVVAVLWLSAQSAEVDDKDIHLTKDSSSDRYFVIIESHNLSDKQAKSISWYSQISSVLVTNVFQRRELKKGECLILVTSPVIKRLKRGSSIEVIGYEIGGDEFGSASTSKGIIVDGKIVTTKDRK